MTKSYAYLYIFMSIAVTALLTTVLVVGVKQGQIDRLNEENKNLEALVKYTEQHVFELLDELQKLKKGGSD